MRSPLTRARRIVQLTVLVLFFALLLVARPVPGQSPHAWLTVFFQLDPLVWLTTSLAARTVASGLLLALLTLVVTIILGRVFCGWFCPLGTIHALASRVANRFRRRPTIDLWSQQLANTSSSPAVLTMCLFGVQWLVLSIRLRFSTVRPQP
ncbi:MAG: 4Fe-4S binding protein [Phycisphaerales bacterium]|nr:4Fe-4S binding protein [Phycisphaerales bacterium]